MEDLKRQLQMIAECLPSAPFKDTVVKVTAAAVAELERLVSERDKYKSALEKFAANAYEQSHGASDFVVTTCEALEKANEALSVYCHACSLAGGADMPIYHRGPACKSEIESV